MRLFSTPSFLLLLIAAPVAAPTRPMAGRELTDSAAVIATVTAFHTALAQADSTRALSLLAPDLLVLESGELETREEYAAHHLPADMAFVRAVPSKPVSRIIRIEGGTAWTAAIETAAGTFEGRKVRSQGAELMVLTKSANGWLIRAIHWSSHRR